MSIKVLHTASATSVGGRNGHARNSDGLVDVDLSVPKGMGGPGKPDTTTPEDLFAAGYAACFGGAVEFMAKQNKIPVTSVEVKADVSIGAKDPSGFGLKVHLTAKVGGVSQADAERAVKLGDQLCPYSNAIRGNVPVEITTQAV